MKQPYIRNVHKDLSIPWFEQIKKEVLFPGEDEPQIYYSLKPPDYVTALTRTTEGKYIILRQYRPAIEDFTFELPSGHLEEGEAPEQGMIRELREETGCSDGEVTMLGETIPDTGRLENRLWAFYVDKVIIKSIPVPAENEGIEVHLLNHEELFQMIRDGKLNHALDLSVITLAILQNHLTL
jgi:8-oxo-dGTP pyrophosphatase MutT (NUDIX family)